MTKDSLSPQNILKQYWGYSEFRPMQEEIIQSVLDEKDTLALLPTGGGKSVCFQVPAMCLEGICIVVSPLIALMKDQVMQLQNKGIKAVSIYSGMKKREIDITLDNCIYGNFKFLYVSPERLKTDLFIERARQMNISLLAIDEAHCISQWGYDFRPPYLELAEFKKTVEIKRTIALTATATKEVRKDIATKLEMKDVQVFQKSFARANLSYSAFRLENKEQKLIGILNNVAGTSIVYVRSRKRTKEIADLLRRSGISSDFYHAGLPGKIRSDKQDAWINNKTRVIVSTNAFGMGIDKSDVRTVIHMDLPDTLEAYYQEAGRGGRDERKAYAVTLYNSQDIDQLKERSEKSIVSIEDIRRTYQALANFYKMAIGSQALSSFDFNYERFINTYNLPIIETYAALKKLSDEGLIQLNEGFHMQSKLSFILEKGKVYEYQVANPKLDPIVKALLRLYGGEVFVGYSIIKEKELASMLKTDERQIRNWLKFLNDQEIVDYQPSTDSHTITFLTPRLEPTRLPIDEKQIEWRRKLAKEKAEKVIEYMETTECRTLAFQHYFDETSDTICGTCDNDLEKKKREGISVLSISELRSSLQENGKTITELRAAFPKYKESQILETMRILINDKEVKQEGNIFVLVG
ncbi:MAG: ATP-dependent DNA helicase RecQ [Ekhidna sp.]